MLYPLFFEPVYKKVIWGGRNLETIFKREIPEGNIGESWEVCSHKNGMSLIRNGYLKGKDIDWIIKNMKLYILGRKNFKSDKFPIMLKIIDANDKLSVQVHPNDEYAMKNEGEVGKTEMWYVLNTEPQAKIVYGLKENMNNTKLRKALKEGNLKMHLNYIDVKKGDVIYIPSGTVHALLQGVIVLEVQQNSDTTYRLYDWDRRDIYGNERELHIDKALDVINFDYIYKKSNYGLICSRGYNKRLLVNDKYFRVDEIEIIDEYIDNPIGETFYIFNCISGKGELIYDKLKYNLKPGETFLIPAFMEDFKIKGNMKVLKIYV